MTAPLRYKSRRHCVDRGAAARVLERVLAPYGDAEIVSHSLGIYRDLSDQMKDACGIRFMLTLGWIETPHQRLFEHGQELPAKLLREGVDATGGQALPMHAWLTSPGFEIIDVLLPIRLGSASGHAETPKKNFYLSDENNDSSVIYHPTAVGDDFIDKALSA